MRAASFTDQESGATPLRTPPIERRVVSWHQSDVPTHSSPRSQPFPIGSAAVPPESVEPCGTSLFLRTYIVEHDWLILEVLERHGAVFVFGNPRRNRGFADAFPVLVEA